MSRGNPYYQSAHWKALRAECIRRDKGQCVVDGCFNRGIVADHIETRPDVPYPCAQDRLDNLRTLCLSHDAQVKEKKRGAAMSRKQDGAFRVKGCDANGWPLSPAHNR